jgi:SAM-dependent methyltransferase
VTLHAAPAPSPPFQIGVSWWQDEDDVVLWHGVLGRALRLHRDSLHEALERPTSPAGAAVRRRLDAFHALATSPRPDWPHLIAVRSRHVLTLVEEASLWLPVPGFRGPGGYGYRSFRLSPEAHAIWREINDQRTLQQIADRAGVSILHTQALCTALTSFELQALQLRGQPPHPRDASLERLVDLPRPPNSRPDHLHGPTGETTLTWYHLHEITDGATHFDDRETTVAHAFAVPHPALHGVAYGAALFQRLQRDQRLDPSTPVVEVGCGTGELARDFRNAGHTGRYTRVDLSPELLATQTPNAPDTHGVLANAIHLPFRDASIELLLSNEVIADLTSVVLDPTHPPVAGPAKDAWEIARRAHLALDPVPQLVNLGAWQFVQEIARVLRPGGRAWISEFGVLEEHPQEAVQLDHPEISIQFDVLSQVARALGLDAEVHALPDALGFDLHARHLARSSWQALRAFAHSRGVHLPARAYTPTSLQELLPTRVDGLRWVAVSDEGPGPLVTRFYVLTLRKPDDAARPGA